MYLSFDTETIPVERVSVTNTVVFARRKDDLLRDIWLLFLLRCGQPLERAGNFHLPFLMGLTHLDKHRFNVGDRAECQQAGPNVPTSKCL